MALQLLETLDVYYGQHKRKLSLCSGDAAALTAQEAVDYLAVSTLPNFYLPDAGTLLYSLNQKGVSVAELAKHKQQDFRPDIPCWISQKVTGINADRLIIFEPVDARNKAVDLVTYIFSAITVQEKGRTNDLKIALPMLCTNYGGVSSGDMMEALFYAAVHWGAMKFPFAEIKIIIYDKESQSKKEELRSQFQALKYNYEHLESLFSGKAYSFYVKQVLDDMKGLSLPEYLTQRQYFGIHLYTSNYYTTINSILRKNDRKSTDFKKHMPLFEAIDTGLMNIPPYAGMTYRGTKLSQEELDKHKVGASYLNLAYTSTAYIKGSWYYGAAVKLDINCHTGCLVKDYSCFPSENEVLYIRYMSYKILEARHTSDYYFRTDECIEKYRR